MSKSCNFKGNQKSFYLEIGQVSSCCRSRSDALVTERNIDSYIAQWQEESRQLDRGVELESCEHCWKDERQGKISYRQQAVTNGKNIIELTISNLCNQMCSYCNPRYSSTWQESIQKHGMFQQVSSTVKNILTQIQQPGDTEYWIKQIQDYIQTCEDNSVVLTLLGGEPLMQQRNLEKLIGFDSNKISTLRVHTNLNPPNNKFLIWILEHIDNSKLEISISLDASPDYNHVPRAGFDQSRFLSNLEILQKKNINFHFVSIVSILSIFDLKNFIRWKEHNNFNIKFYKLNNPECLDPQYVPRQFRQAIWNQISHLDVPPIISEVLHQADNIVDLKLFEQYNYLTQYFSRVEIDPEQIPNELFVEYWTWLTQHINERFKR